MMKLFSFFLCMPKEILRVSDVLFPILTAVILSLPLSLLPSHQKEMPPSLRLQLTPCLRVVGGRRRKRPLRQWPPRRLRRRGKRE